MRKLFLIFATFQFTVIIALSSPSLAPEWEVRRLRGILRVVDLHLPSTSVISNYLEGLVNLGKDNNRVPCLAEDWRWIGDRTIEFKLRRGATFHNGEQFNSGAVRINWGSYRKMEYPSFVKSANIPDETELEIIDDYRVPSTFPKPEGLAMLKFYWFDQMAPAFFEERSFEEFNWGTLPIAGLGGRDKGEPLQNEASSEAQRVGILTFNELNRSTECMAAVARYQRS